MPGSTNSAASSGASKWEPPSVERLQELLPQYEITALIGRGGMGAVYKGVQTTLGRTVAIKLLPESLQEDAGDAGFVERFKLEARAMASLDHPAIISVFDFGQTSEGHLYFVMEFIDGMDLQQYLNASGGKLEVEAAVAIISHVLDALEYAHKKGIVHRDIKPANVLINSEGRVKIADFGLAKQIGGEASGLTMSNVAMGTPDFIAPEALLDSASSDGRADLYAVGVMLYQMLTGKLPRGMFKLPSEEDASFDPRFDDIIASALEPNPEHRFSAAGDFRKKLDELRSQPVSRIEGRSTIERRGAKTQDVTPAVKRGLPARPAARKSGGGVMWAVVAVALLGGGGWLIWGGKKRGGPEPTEMPPAEFWDAPSSAAGSKKGESGQKDAAPRTQQADATWPSDDHYRSAGRFRAWSSIPNDPQMDISALAKLTSVKQVEVHRAGWVFIRDDGTLKANSNGADGMGSVARIERGYNQRFATIDIDGTLRLWPILKAQEKIADGIGPVVSAFHCDDFVAAVTRDGQLEIRGKAFDDPSAENKNRWIDRPQLDPNDRVVGLAACDECLAVRLSTGDIRIWRPDGRRFSPPNGFLEGDLNDCAVNRASLFVSMGPGNTVKSLITRNDPPTHGVERDFTGIETFESTQLGMAGITSDQRLLIHSSLADSFPDLIEVAKKVKDPQPDLISIFASPDFGARLLWFEPEEPPIPEGAASAKETPAPPQTVPKPSPAPKPRIDGLVANGEWQDVLPLLASGNAKFNGKWTFGPNGLEGIAVGSRASIGLPTQPLVDYEAQIRIAANKCKSIGFLLPTPQGAMSLIAHVESDQIVLADGSNLELNPSTQSGTIKAVDGEIHEFLIRVSSAEVTLFLDGTELYRYRPQDWGEVTQMAVNSFPLADTPTLGLRLQEANVLFQSFRIRIPDATPSGTQSDSAAAKAVEEIEGVQSRIANFQKARHQQLADLTGKYQKALASAKTAASKAGNAAHEKAIQLAMSRAANFAKEIEKLPATKTVAPLPALPALDASTSDALKKLRKIFDAETAKIEANLLAKLDLSLEAFQTSMLEAGDLEVVDALRAYRKAVVSSSIAANLPLQVTPTQAKSAIATKDKPFENSLGMKFVPVPIQGGATDGQALLFSVWETRVQDYEVFVKQTKRKWPKPDFPQGPDHPAVMVSWEDATAFCDWLTQRERQAGTIGTDQVYRLPSDHEWSCAAGIAGGENAADTPERKLAGASKLYPWGRDWPPPNGSGNYNGQETLRNPFDGTPMGGYNDGFDRTAPVGSFAPTTSGLYDLGGNVVEWCSDRWDGKASTAKTVLRGGSWRDGQERFHLSSFRFGMPANQSDDRAGFRCVLAPIGGATASNEDRWIDLIAAVDPVKDVSTRNNWRADQNLWEKQGSDLVFLESNSSGEILLPNTENITDFEIRMAMTRESGTRGIDFKIPTPGGATPIIFGGNTGSQLKGNPRPFNFVSHPLTTGQKMEVVVTVRSTGTNAGIKVEADGKPIIDWKGDYRSDLGVIDNYQSKRIGLWIGLPPTSDPVSKFRFHEILFQPL